MALIDHFSGPDNTTPIDPQISGHTMSSAMWAWMTGKTTRAVMVSRMGLDDTAGNDKEGLDSLEAEFTNLPINKKSEFKHDLESGLELYEVGLILNQAELITFLGL